MHPSIDPVAFLLQQKARSFEVDCSSRAQRLSQQRTMREVKFVADVHARNELRFVPGVRNAIATLHSEAAKRMQTLLEDHLQELRKCPDLESFKEMRARYLRNDWIFLRGDYPLVAQQANFGAQKIQGKLEVANRAPTAQTEQDAPASKAPRPR